MTVGKINVDDTIQSAQELLEQEKDISPSLKAVVSLLIQLVTLLIHKKTSSNSGIPPSKDENRQRGSKRRTETRRKPGGQKGRVGSQLKPVDTPDETIEYPVKQCIHCKNSLKKQSIKRADSRQEFEIEIRLHVIEHRVEVKECPGCGKETRGNFPEGVTRPAQYGSRVRALMVYLGQFQLVPYERLRELFENFSLPLSTGTLANTVQMAHERLEDFDRWARARLISSKLIHADETGFYINKKRYWLHCQTNTEVTLMYPHAKRGIEGIVASGVLSSFNGYLCRDDWWPYGKLTNCTHLCCHTHLIRDLVDLEERFIELKWPKRLRRFLEKTHAEVTQAGGALKGEALKRKKCRLQKILSEAQRETPPPKTPRSRQKKRGRVAKGDARNLLERFLKHRKATELYLSDPEIPFTNNQAEQDIRMAKVQQKISGCFRSWEGAQAFCRIRSYVITARKNGQSALDALQMLFKGEKPAWMC